MAKDNGGLYQHWRVPARPPSTLYYHTYVGEEVRKPKRGWNALWSTGQHRSKMALARISLFQGSSMIHGSLDCGPLSRAPWHLVLPATIRSLCYPNWNANSEGRGSKPLDVALTSHAARSTQHAARNHVSQGSSSNSIPPCRRDPHLVSMFPTYS